MSEQELIFLCFAFIAIWISVGIVGWKWIGMDNHYPLRRWLHEVGELYHGAERVARLLKERAEAQSELERAGWWAWSQKQICRARIKIYNEMLDAALEGC